MNYQKAAVIATSILALTLVFWLVWRYSCQPETNQQTTYEAVQKTTDKVIAVNDTAVFDSAKLQKRQNFKRRVATAKVDR